MFDVLRAASQPTTSDVPDLNSCSTPVVPLKERLVRVSLAPDRKLLGTWSLLRNCRLPISCGSHTPREMSTSAWASCGLMRSTCTSRFCSRAIFTASSMVRRRVGPPPFCSSIGAACEAGVVAVPCPAGVGARGTGCAATGGAGAGWAGAGAGWGCAGTGAPCPNPDAGTAAITSATSAARTTTSGRVSIFDNLQGNSLARRGPSRRRPVGAAQCKKQGVGVADRNRTDRRTGPAHGSPGRSGAKLYRSLSIVSAMRRFAPRWAGQAAWAGVLALAAARGPAPSPAPARCRRLRAHRRQHHAGPGTGRLPAQRPSLVGRLRAPLFRVAGRAARTNPPRGRWPAPASAPRETPL